MKLDSAKDGVPREITSGLFRVRMPLPFELSHINLWLLRGAKGWSIIDTGFNYGETLAYWSNIFGSFFAPLPVENIFVTHFHPDHFGLAGQLSRQTGVTLRMTAGEIGMVRGLMDTDGLKHLYEPYYTEAGVSGTLFDKMIEKRLMYRKIVSDPPDTVETVKLGDSVTLGDRVWRLTGGGGHSPEHACLYAAADGIFIAGDVVLPGITPNISFFPGHGPEHDPLADYFATLETVRRDVPDDVLVLPSHGEPFRGLHSRIDQIRVHHEGRLRKVREICLPAPQTALQVMESLFSHRELTSADLFFALGETLAHLVHDEKQGKVAKVIKDGVAFYRAV